MSTALLTSLTPGSRRNLKPVHSARLSGEPISVAPDVALLPLSLVNVYFIGPEGAGDREWFLVDTGLRASARWIRKAAAQRFGSNSRPKAIILTHGHFDHVGSAEALAAAWDCPVYIHQDELPFVTGQRAYPPPDPSVGGGLMSLLSFAYPRGPYDLGGRAQALPSGGVIPGLEGWRWIETPGHSLGHISLYRDHDGTLIAGDAFVTQPQESAIGVLTMLPAVRRPPAYFTTDWDAARESIRRLRELEPNIALTGHGVPMYGDQLRQGLKTLLRNWNSDALPATGRYLPYDRPARREAAASSRETKRTIMIAAGIGAFVGLVTIAALKRRT
jgi:glyoxylase-like metal-dependent hydrolase (beta-lactamase superfamily II)